MPCFHLPPGGIEKQFVDVTQRFGIQPVSVDCRGQRHTRVTRPILQIDRQKQRLAVDPRATVETHATSTHHQGSVL